MDGPKLKPNCYECIHRRSLLGSVHSECVHPEITPSDRVYAPALIQHEIPSKIVKQLKISTKEAAIRHKWFLWPVNYDPVWLESCSGFEKK